MSETLGKVLKLEPGQLATHGQEELAKLKPEELSTLEDHLIGRSQARLQSMTLNASERLMRGYERGEKHRLLQAIFDCANAKIPLHDWAAKAFTEEFLNVKVRCLHRSWDEVFGKPHRDDKKLPAAALRYEKQWKIWVRVTDLRSENPHTDVFPEVAAAFGVSVALCKKLFYAAEKMANSDDEDRRTVAQFAIKGARYELSK